MKVDNFCSVIFTTKMGQKTGEANAGSFSDALVSRMESSKAPYMESSTQKEFSCRDYRRLFPNTVVHKRYTNSVKPVETNRYRIVEEQRGVLTVYDKERNECADLKLNKEQIRVDKATGMKFIISDFGSGIFTMVAVDSELEAGLKEALGTDELEEEELKGFTVHTDKKTGMRYVTADGYEGCGGFLIIDEEGKAILDSLAKEFLEEYPNLMRTYNEAWFYATFEVRGLVKRTPNGILRIGPNCISFDNKDGVNRWVSIFDPKDWKKVKEKFDSGSVGEMEDQNFWKAFFEIMKIDAFFVIPDRDGDRRVEN